METITPLNSNRVFGKNDSPWVSVFNLCNAAIGSGVLSFPYGFRQTGVVGGFFCAFIIWVIEVFALCLLIRVAEKHNSQSYQQIVLSTLGPHMAVLTSLVMLVLTYGGAVSYLLITGDVFQPAFADVFGEGSILADRRGVITLFALVVILPLALKTTLKALKYSSVISVFMLAYLTVALTIIGIKTLIYRGIPSDILVWEAGQHAFITLDIVVFAFLCHIQVVTIFAELAEMPKPFFGEGKEALEERLLDDAVVSQISARRKSERVKRMDGVIFVSMSICFIGYCMVGEFGYLIFPDVESDVLKSFGNCNPFMTFARYGMAVVAMVCYPLQSHPARSIVDDGWKAIAGVPANGFSWTRHILLTMLFFLSTLGIALVITDLGTVFSIVGSTGGVMVGFIIPGILLVRGIYSPALGCNASTDEEEIGQLSTITRTRFQVYVQTAGGILIVAFGLLIFMATSYVTATKMKKG